MKVSTYVHGKLLGKPAIVARCYQNILEAVCRNNEALMGVSPNRYPPLYSSGIRFRPEHGTPGEEDFSDCETVLRRGYGDCANLAAYRVAELRRQGHAATIRIYWRLSSDGAPKLFHVQVRMPSGAIEDPSRFLGMKG